LICMTIRVDSDAVHAIQLMITGGYMAIKKENVYVETSVISFLAARPTRDYEEPIMATPEELA